MTYLEKNVLRDVNLMILDLKKKLATSPLNNKMVVTVVYYDVYLCIKIYTDKEHV